MRRRAGGSNPSVQPLWRARARGLPVPRVPVGFGGVRIGAGRIAMPRGMELTLNGLAQGFITDRIVDLLRAGGAEHTLVDMGEIRALGGPWRVALGEERVDLTDRAMATTEAGGFRFPDGTPHLIDPMTGAARASWPRLAVIAPEAGLADALSTGLSLADADTIRATLAALPGVQVLTPDRRFG
ncbi:FAD:protein FMN transferase [Paenirhodobacter sp.]|uniref:FAD:protein FMN transferase n=1 Tax=Paenirhodobacter sp. TaxID=1965326 RepID=UPI003B3C50CC